jgi:hypothetical protein
MSLLIFLLKSALDPGRCQQKDEATHVCFRDRWRGRRRWHAMGRVPGESGGGPHSRRSGELARATRRPYTMQMLLDKLAVMWSAAFPAKTLILEKAVEPQKSAKGSKYQPVALPDNITQRVMAHPIQIFLVLWILRLFAAIQILFRGSSLISAVGRGGRLGARPAVAGG